MSSKQIHSLAEHGCRRSIATFRPHSFPANLAPLVSCKTIFIQVIFIMSIISSKNVHVWIEDYRWMWMSWTWTSFRVNWLHQTPFSSCDTVSMKVVDAIVAIIPTKNINAPVIDDRSVTISRRWRRWTALRNYFYPIICLKAEAEKIVPPICAIVSTKNIKIVF